jgi:hypothetical protein
MSFLKPNYSIDEIESILKTITTTENVDKEIISDSLVLIGAYLGYNELLNRKMVITNQIMENVKYVSSNIFRILYLRKFLWYKPNSNDL